MIRKNLPAAGFTILELLVVIAIIAIVIAIFVANQTESRQVARNTTLLAQMGEYETALNYYYSERGVFPGPSSAAARRTERCLGKGSENGGCWNGANSPDTYLEAALVPDYLPELPGVDQGEFGSPAFNGCDSAYFNDTNARCTTNDFSMYFLLEGANRDCGRFHTADTGYDGGTMTMCILRLRVN